VRSTARTAARAIAMLYRSPRRWRHVAKPPEDKPYGHRNAGVIDRNGITWWIGPPVK